MADPYAPPKPVAPPPVQQPNQFDAMRRRMQQTNQLQLGKAQDQQNEALNRKFASAGISNSGAAIRAQQLGNQELQGQFNEQLSQQQGAVDQMEQGQNFQSLEAQKGRDFQGGQFDRTFALDQEMKRAQLGLAGREMDLKDQEQQFNIGGTLNDRGYGVDMSQFASTNARDASGRLINPNGQGIGYEESQGMYQQQAMQRRLDDQKRQEEMINAAAALQFRPSSSWR
jgi:hypothetical protein